MDDDENVLKKVITGDELWFMVMISKPNISS